MNPSRPFILRPVATSLMMVAILLAGLIATYTRGGAKASDPQVLLEWAFGDDERT